jgi:drug/metabolite transporter (DMT)-like permease
VTAPGVSEGHGRGEAALAACAVLWSSAGLFIKLVDAHPLAIAGGRSLLALGVLLAFTRRPRFTFSVAQIGAGVANAATMILFVAANKLTTSANSILLQYAAPVYVALLSVPLLRERVRPRDVMALAAVAGGTLLFFLERVAPGNMLGNFFAALSGVTFAFVFVLLRRQKDGSPSESLMISHLLTVVVSIPFWRGFAPSAANLAGIGFLGIFQIGLAGVLLAYGMRRVAALAAVLIVTIEPILNPVWVFLITGERPTPLSTTGGAVILAAVLLLQIVDARERAVARSTRRGASEGTIPAFRYTRRR